MNSTAVARLNQVAGRQTLRLTHYGRRSGKPHEVAIWFVVAGDKIYLPTGNVNRQWVRNVKKTPRVRLSIGGELFDGEARFLTDPREAGHVMALVRRKYWMFLPFIAVWRIFSWLGLATFAKRQSLRNKAVPGPNTGWVLDFEAGNLIPLAHGPDQFRKGRIGADGCQT